MVKNCLKVCFPLEPDIRKEEVLNASEGEQGTKEQLEEKIPVAEMSRLELSKAETQDEEISAQNQESKF